LVDAWTYTAHPARLLFVDGYEVLCHIHSRWVLERIFHENPAMFETLRETYAIPRYAYESDTREALDQLLGTTFMPFDATVNPFARLIFPMRSRNARARGTWTRWRRSFGSWRSTIKCRYVGILGTRSSSVRWATTRHMQSWRRC
jgi:hypothetical protein